MQTHGSHLRYDGSVHDGRDGDGDFVDLITQTNHELVSYHTNKPES